MIPERYPAPAATTLFSDESKVQHWRAITNAYGHSYLEEVGGDNIDILHSELDFTLIPTLQKIREHEALYGHDVVAFLSAYTEGMSEELKPFIHHGLTSSDLVEYGLFAMCSEHTMAIGNILQSLSYECATHVGRYSGAIRPGRTHGQIADHSSWGHTVNVALDVLSNVQLEFADLEEATRVVKWAGPTGWPGSNPKVHARGRRVADVLNASYHPATQVLHRDLLLRWACAYLRLACVLENLALQVRLSARAEVAEVREGAPERVGSSAMPHKQNPIDSEKVCGLARIARGYFMAISEEVALWEDRDLSNSSLERVAVPGLAAIVEHMAIVMVGVIRDLVVDVNVMQAHAADARTKTNVMQVVAQEVLNLGPIEAGRLIREGLAKHPNFPDMWMVDVEESLLDRGYDDAPDWKDLTERRWGSRFPVEIF